MKQSRPIAKARPRRPPSAGSRGLSASTTATFRPLSSRCILLVGPPVVRHPRKLVEDAAGDRQHRARAGAGPDLLSQVAAPRERLHHRHQRRHPGALARLLALRAVQRDLDHVEVRAARQRPPPLEPVQLRHRRDAVPGRRHRGQPQHPVGQYLLPMVVIWVLGSVIIWRLRRFHITGTYVVSFLAFALLRSYLTGSPWLGDRADHRARCTSSSSSS